RPSGAGPSARPRARPRAEPCPTTGSVVGVRLVTWNVNSLKARLERVEQWLAECEPDVVCMQETKLADTAFPTMAFSALGYESAHHGEGRWPAVGCLVRAALSKTVLGLENYAPAVPEARCTPALCVGGWVWCRKVP